ncbi:MAG: O-antigen ligase family protein [Proteobacteria bacterium]|nr:O-antigen ligase family protein [Pseudomonadota bacterium]
MYRLHVTFLCILLIICLFWIDRKNKNIDVSPAIWIPFVWLFFASARPFSFWLHYFFGIGYYAGSIENAKIEGNPYERIYLIILILSGIIVLIRRKLDWGKLFNQNTLIWMYFIFGALSFLWSDYPFVSFKRWVKSLGTVIIVLIIITESKPYEAIGIILRRISFICLPLSILFIWYYPKLGISYHSFSGGKMYTGIAEHKNSLGSICLVSCVYFTWKLLFSNQNKDGTGPPLHSFIYIVILPMIVWLLYMANSATSLACSIAAICLLLVSRLSKFVQNPRKILILGILGIIAFGLMQWAFDVKNIIITMLGRRTDLTTRVPMWKDMLSMVKNPLLGFGYESFWLGERLEQINARWGIDSQAHNGYLQMYLDLGYTGLFFLIGWIISGLKKVARHLAVDYPAAIFRCCFIVIVALYNYTEATFLGGSALLFLFLFAAIDYNYEMNKNIQTIQTPWLYSK